LGNKRKVDTKQEQGDEPPERPCGDEVTPEVLLAHAGFVRALARGLLRDEAAVEDVVQETLTRALERGPRRREALASWLRTVVRNIAFKSHRARARREAREADVAKPEALPDTTDLLVRDAALRDLTAAVLDLPEQAREAVMLRYFDGLSPQAIGERLGLPSGTVRMRLHRALVALRRRLDHGSNGDRSRWMHGLALLAGVPPEAPPAVLPARDPAPWLALAGGATALVVLGALWVDRGPEVAPATSSGAERIAAATKSRDADMDQRAGVPSSADPRNIGRQLAAEPLRGLDVTPDRSVADPAGAVVRGRVVDARGVGVAGAEVLVASGGSELIPAVRSGADGVFEFALEGDVSSLLMRQPILFGAQAHGHAPSGVIAIHHDRGVLERQPMLRLRAGEGVLDLSVLDSDGAPVSDAVVRVGERLRHGLALLGPMTAAEENPLAPQLAARVARDEQPLYLPSADLRGNLGALLLLSDGSLTAQGPPQHGRTDGAGRLRLAGLEPGRTRVFVTAAGFAPLAVQVTVRGQPARGMAKRPRWCSRCRPGRC
jgi:RNA polymerase sigma-70 factor (ECF subfamily)